MNNHNLNKPKTNNHPSPNQELYHPIFQVGKPWPSGLERRLKKYGWFSSGHTKQISNPETDHLSTPELNHHSIHGRRSRALAQVLPTLNGGWNSSSRRNAFTIIEVVLVLAIAGLIFLMVFIALPALQRNQRDTQRKNDISKLKSALENYKSNNRGNLPSDTQLASEFTGRYLTGLDGGFNDPDGSRYTLGFIEVGRAVSGYYTHRDVGGEMMRQIFLVRGARCANGTTSAFGSTNNFSILIKLEGGGTYCIGD